MSVGHARDVQRRAVQARAPAPLGREQLPPAGVVDGCHLETAVDLERQRGAEDRQAVGEVGGAVQRIEDPAVPGLAVVSAAGTPRRARRVQGNRSAIIARNMRSTQRSTSVTRSIAPFLSTRIERAERGELNVASTKDGVDGRGEQQRIERHRHSWCGDALAPCAPPCPPPAPADRHVVHEAAHEEDAAAARLQQVLGRQRIGQVHRDRTPRPGPARGRPARTRTEAGASRTPPRRACSDRAGCRA